jgi:transcriptional regulator with XRE-family HTH domain
MKKQSAGGSELGSRVFQLRKERGWSQPELGKKIGTSGDIIGRYERGDMTPSVEVARKLARVLGVTVDYLAGEHDLPEALKDPAMLDRWKALEEIAPDDRDRILYLVDGLIRDARTRQAYAAR